MSARTLSDLQAIIEVDRHVFYDTMLLRSQMNDIHFVFHRNGISHSLICLPFIISDGIQNMDVPHDRIQEESTKKGRLQFIFRATFPFYLISLILCLFCIFLPHAESAQRLIAHQGNHRLMAVFYLAVYLLVDKLIIETYLGCILSVVGIIDTTFGCVAPPPSIFHYPKENQSSTQRQSWLPSWLPVASPC